MKTILFSVSLVIALCVSVFPAGEKGTTPDERSLLAAWEQALRTDPNTEILEKTADRSYHFKTKLFPFDGELRVLNTLVQDFSEEEYLPGFVFGTVEVELVGFSQELMAKYARSYGYWYELNTLYFDLHGGRWLTAREYRSVMPRRMKDRYGSPLHWLAQNYFWIIMLLLAIFLWWVAKRSGKQMKSALQRQDEVMDISRRSIALSERAVALNEEGNMVLKEILQELKRDKQEMKSL